MSNGLLQYEYFSSVTQHKVEWLWYPYIPYGKLTILQGDPGEGKSTFMLNVAALLTRGKNMPDGYQVKEPQKVVYAQKDFKSHEVPDSVYAGSSSLEINSLRLCSLVAKLHGWDRGRSYRVPGKYSTELNVVIFRLYEAEIIERAVSS